MVDCGIDCLFAAKSLEKRLLGWFEVDLELVRSSVRNCKEGVCSKDNFVHVLDPFECLLLSFSLQHTLRSVQINPAFNVNKRLLGGH